jgi:hypothetical protein
VTLLDGLEVEAHHFVLSSIQPVRLAMGGYLEIWNNKTSLTYPRYRIVDEYMDENKEEQQVSRVVANSMLYVMQSVFVL